jgi:lipopolysaccharide transport system ATP-binding protein
MFVKLAFSVAAHLQSEILIMDEVLAVGDMAFQKKCLNKMSEVSQSEGRTILYVSHNMNTIRQLCDRCIVMDHGKIIYNGDVEEAISIYLGTVVELLPVHYDLDKTDRPSKQHGHRIHLTSFDFIDKTIASYNAGEDIRFEISFIANEDISGLKLYFVVKGTDDQIVGMTQSYEPFGDAQKGKIYSQRFVMGFPDLAEGKYYFYADVFSDDGQGNHWSYDHPSERIIFEIRTPSYGGLNWNARSYGHVVLPEIISVSNSTTDM